MTLEQGLIIAVGGLASAVIAMWVWFKASHTRLEGVVVQQAEDHAEELCKRDAERSKLIDRLIELERAVGWLQCCPLVACPFRQSVAKKQDDAKNNQAA